MTSGFHFYFQPSLGGGERYLLTAAEALQDRGPVEVLTPRPVERSTFETGFGLDLRNVGFQSHPWRRFHTLRDRLLGPRYDFFMALENHRTPRQVGLGKRSVLHIQTPPYPDIRSDGWTARLKRRSYPVIVCNSEYTRRWVLRGAPESSDVRVIYPPVDVLRYPARVKRNLILSVGRFFRGRHEKRHDILIEAFRQLLATERDPWELHLAGSLRSNRSADVAYLEALKTQAQDLPVRFHVNASLDTLQRLYGEARVYWHAAGYGIDEDRHPQFLEHFGMSIVEAMAAGAIPFVVGRGGPLEIVQEGETGFFWVTVPELVTRTRTLMGLEDERLHSLRDRAIARARTFSKEAFVRAIRELADQSETHRRGAG